MSERARYQRRKAYFAKYCRDNLVKRRENLRRWSAANREHVNAYARAWRAKRRALLGLPEPKPRAKPTPKPAAVAPAVTVPRTPSTLRQRFLAYRKAVST